MDAAKLMRLVGAYASATASSEIAYSRDLHPTVLRRYADKQDAARLAVERAIAELFEGKS